MQANIHPYTRIAFFITGIAGGFFCTSNLLLLGFWLLILLPLMMITGNAGAHMRFLLVVVLPMAAMLLLLSWIVSEKSSENFDQVLLTILKVIAYTTIVQVVLIIPPEQVYSTFRKWGLKGDTLVTSLGSYIVWVDIVNRSGKILTARFARGFIAERTFIAKLKQMPHLLIPLIVSIIRTATERSESWQQKQLLQRVGVMKAAEVSYSKPVNAVMLIAGMGWLLLNIFLKWNS
jgi:energy-coupling factor transporter transmembrane protein EcfT